MTPQPHTSPRMFRILWSAVRHLPPRYGSKPRVAVLRRAGARVGESVRIGPRVRVIGPAGLEIGDHVGVARDALLDARAGISLGTGSMVGFEAMLLTWTHRFDDPERFVAGQGSAGSRITVASGAWIGTRAILLSGVVVGSDAIVGAASVVTRNVDDHTIVAGNPAREVRRR